MSAWKWFVGLKPKGVPVVFAFIGKPTKTKFPQFKQVIGPFTSEENAYFYVDQLDRLNPGAAWHNKEAANALFIGLRTKKGSFEEHYSRGYFDAHIASQREAKRLGMNPPQKKSLNGVIIYDDILEIRARKGSKSLWPKENFKHTFKKGAEVIGLKDGSLLIRSKKGRKLWKIFDY